MPADHRRREAKALGIISEIVPRDGGTNIALSQVRPMREEQALSEVMTATPDEKERRFL